MIEKIKDRATLRKKAVLEKPAFFYIPDISGYTNFIKGANLKEGSKLIHDLLESIIDSNIIKMNVAEIQGDSIWFYKFGKPVSIYNLEKQAKKTFLDFQSTLNTLKKSHPLLAGAADLTVKIVVHYGKVVETEVKNTLKLIGSDTVIAHRIMKNNVSVNEYLLMTQQYVSTQQPLILKKKIIPFLWSKVEKGASFYEHIGEVQYDFVSLTPLRTGLKD